MVAQWERLNPRGWHVYCLYDAPGADRPFYVGRSRNIHGRISGHALWWGDRLAEVAICRCESELDAALLEADLIDRYDPVENDQGRPGHRPVSGPALASERVAFYLARSGKVLGKSTERTVKTGQQTT
jgi:hypothetical protein